MSDPKREDFPPGLDGFKAWQRALGKDIDPRGPWDPAKWGEIGLEHVPRGQTGRPVGRLHVGEGGPIAEIYRVEGVPPTDLRVRWITALPGAAALNAFFAGLHPMELQHVLPPIAAGEEVLLAAQPVGHPALPDGRQAAVLDSGGRTGRWSLQQSTEGSDDVQVTGGEREHLVWLARLYADVVLGSLGDRPVPPWIEPVRVARDALRAEAGEPFKPIRER